jgi:GT2 family glycosyltransferase
MLNVVMASYNSPEMTIQAVKHAQAALRRLTSQGRVILVDDASIELGIVAWARQHEVECIVHDNNLGPHAAWQTGVEAMDADADLVLLGNDVYVPEVTFMGMLSDMWLYDLDMLSTAEMIQPLTQDNFEAASATWAQSGDLIFGQGIGACCIIKRAALDDVGGFDGQFLRTFGDTDWNERARMRHIRMAAYQTHAVLHGGAVSRKRGGAEVDLQIDLADHERFLAKWAEYPEVCARHVMRHDAALALAAKKQYWEQGQQ